MVDNRLKFAWLQRPHGRNWLMTGALILGFVWAIHVSYAHADLLVPDGSDGLVPVTARVSQAAPWTVPVGQNFYLLRISAFSKTCADGSMITLCRLITQSPDTTNLHNFSVDGHYILGPGTALTTPATDITFDISGFTVPAQVPVILMDLPPNAGYTVPAGKNLYIMALGIAQSGQGQPTLSVGGVAVAPSTNGPYPLVIGSGQTVVNNGKAIETLDGYLK